MKLVDWLKQIPNPFSKVDKAEKITSRLPIIQVGGVSNGVTNSFPQYNVDLFTIERMSRESDTLVAILKALRMEIFRNGLEVSPAESVEEDVNVSSEEETIQVSNMNVRKAILERMEKVNQKGEHLIDVLEQLENDYNTFDLAFMFFRFSYNIDDKKEIASKDLLEVIRLDPKIMRFVVNERGEFGKDDQGNKLMVSPADRTRLIKNSETDYEGRKLYPAFYAQKGPDGKEYYFFEWEITHDSRYRPELLTGYSPIVSVWQKTATLWFQDFYMLEYYQGKRPPKHMLLFNTANEEGLGKAWQNMLERVQRNPNLPTVMGVPTDPGRKGEPAMFIDFMRSLDEMQFTEVRNEFRRQIGAVFGVLPLWQGDMSQGGGLNNEGLQITVTNRAIEYAQNRYNRKFLRRFVEALNYSGWVITLNPSEEQDEMAKLQRQSQSLQNGLLALQAGLEAKYDEDTGEVKILPGPLSSQSLGSGVIPRLEGEGEKLPPPKSSPSSSSIVRDDVGKSFKKKDKPSFTQLSKLLKEEIEKFLKTFKRAPSEKEMRGRVQKIQGNLQAELDLATHKLFEQVYKESMDRVEKEIGMNLVFGERDVNALRVLKEQKVLKDSFKGLSDNIVEELQNAIFKAYYSNDGLSLKDLNERIEKIAEVSDSRAELIARTETSKVSSAARKNSYFQADPKGELKYKHIGPDDNRTTNLSKRIKARTAQGVSWDEYVRIVKEESVKDFPEWSVDDNFPVSHYQSRHTFIAFR